MKIINAILTGLIIACVCHGFENSFLHERIDTLDSNLSTENDHVLALQQQVNGVADSVNDTIARANTNTVDIQKEFGEVNNDIQAQVAFNAKVVTAINQLQGK